MLISPPRQQTVRWWNVAIAALLLHPTANATDYYLGSQAALQPGIAVASVAALNQLRLAPGDRVFFQAGETFAGTIYLEPDDAGTPERPVELTSFGEGHATIAAGDGSGLVIDNAGGISVSKLDFVGAGKSRNTRSGIDAGAHLPGSTKLEHLRFSHLRISGFRYGVEIWGWHSTDNVAWPGFRDVVLTELEVFDNLSEGIRVWGTWVPDHARGDYSHADFRVSDCTVYDQHGDPSSTVHTGTGIVISGVDGAVVERCVVRDNGGLGPPSGGGPFGILVFDAARCTVQHNLVYNQKSSSRSDGGAIDLDGGATDCLVQYNYSYNNAGPAFALIQFEGGPPITRNTIRYNISENDCRSNPQGSLYVGQFSPTHGIDGADIYGNTIHVSANSSGEQPPAVRVEDHAQIANLRFRNNLFVATHAGPLIDGAVTRPALALYQGNGYWGGAFDLAGFRDSGQEILDGRELGHRVDPELTRAGQGGALTHPSQFSQLPAYRLPPGSPLAHAGLDLQALFGLDVGPRDFFGTPIVASSLPVGAAALPLDDNPPIRLVNLSVRSNAGRGSKTLIVGFVIGGAGASDVLVRAIGPGLASAGLDRTPIADSRLTLFQANTSLAENDDWGGGAPLRGLFASLGASPLTPTSKDAALSQTFGGGVYTAHLTSKTDAVGVGMIELYAASRNAPSRFINVSARTHVGIGADVLIAGLVLDGAGEKKLLIRAVGPSLISSGVDPESALLDPVVTLYRDSTPLASNDNWGGSTELKNLFATIGAGAFAANSSRDAALLVSLGAGVYTAHVSGVGGTTGVALVEIYEVP